MDEAQQQQMMEQGVPSDQLHGPQEAGGPQVIAPEQAQAMADQQQMAAPEGGAPAGQEEQIAEEEPDEQAQKFYESKMLGHLDEIKNNMEDDPNFKEGLIKSNIGPELVGELAHWDKKRVIDLLRAIIEEPSVGQHIHDAYQQSIFHGREMIEQWREHQYHSADKDKESSDVPMDDENSAIEPIGDEVVPNMDDESGNSATSDPDDMEFLREKSNK